MIEKAPVTTFGEAGTVLRARCRATVAAVFAAGLAVSVPAAAMLNLKAGQELPVFALPDRAGAEVSSKNPVPGPSLILFWSTWSPRSEELLRDAVGYHREFAARGLRILAVNIDGENLDAGRRAGIETYAERMDLPFPILLDGQLSLFSRLGVVAHPSVVVADARGIVTWILGGYPPSLREQLREELLKALGESVAAPPAESTSVGYVPLNGALQYHNMGRLLLEKGETEKARAAFRTAIERDPSFFEPVVMDARLESLFGERGRAAAALELFPADALNRDDVRFLEAYLQLREGEVARAEAGFSVIRDRAPGLGWGWWGLGMVHLAREDAAGALDRFEQARKLQPECPEAVAAVREHLLGFWSRRAHPPEEDRFLRLFPEFDELRRRYAATFGTFPDGTP